MKNLILAFMMIFVCKGALAFPERDINFDCKKAGSNDKASVELKYDSVFGWSADVSAKKNEKTIERTSDGAEMAGRYRESITIFRRHDADARPDYAMILDFGPNRALLFMDGMGRMDCRYK